MDENRQKALGAALAQIEKQFGTGSIMRMGDPGAIRNVEAVSSGSLTLDIALGVGGLPKGRVVEIYGPESSGKTTLALHVVAEIQKQGFRDFNGLADFSASINVDDGSIIGPQIAIRGFGTTGNSVTTDSSTPIFVDGIHYSRNSMLKAAFMDAQQVEGVGRVRVDSGEGF